MPDCNFRDELDAFMRDELHKSDSLRRVLALAEADTDDVGPASTGAPRGARSDSTPGGATRACAKPDFFRYVQRELVRRLEERTVQGGGLRVQTTVDPGLQALAREAMAGYLDERFDPAAALVAIDPSTGAIRAMTSWIPSGQRLQFSLPWQGRRQAGSAAKVFTLTAALEGASHSPRSGAGPRRSRSPTGAASPASTSPGARVTTRTPRRER